MQKNRSCFKSEGGTTGHDLFFLTADNNSITTYSGKLFAAGLKKAGYPVKVVQDDHEKRKILASLNNGTIIFQKCLHPLHQADSIKHLKGQVALIHIDDDWMDMQNKGHLDTLKMTDLILVVSKEHQAALARIIGTPCVQIRTLPDMENFKYYPFSQRKNDPLIVAWQQSCADGYVKDLLTIAEPLRKLHDKYGFRLKLYGWRLGKGFPDYRYLAIEALPFAELIPYVPLADYFKKIVPEIRQADVYIVPYVDHYTRRGKGGFGLRRMMMLGVPAVVSAIGFHNELITDGVNGYLAGTPEEWYQKLGNLLSDPGLREKFSVNGRILMEGEYGYDKCLQIFIDAIRPYLKYAPRLQPF